MEHELTVDQEKKPEEQKILNLWEMFDDFDVFDIWAVELRWKSRWGYTFWVKYYFTEAEAVMEYKHQVIDEILSLDYENEHTRSGLNDLVLDDLDDLLNIHINKHNNEYGDDSVFDISYYSVLDKISQ